MLKSLLWISNNYSDGHKIPAFRDLLSKNCWNKNYNENNIVCYNPDSYSTVAKINILHAVRLHHCINSSCQWRIIVPSSSLSSNSRRCWIWRCLWSFETQGTVYPIMQSKNSKKLGSLIFYMPFLQPWLFGKPEKTTCKSQA